jgi:hypothetical protein
VVQPQALANAFLSNVLIDKVVAVSVQTCKLFRPPEKGLLDTQGGWKSPLRPPETPSRVRATGRSRKRSCGEKKKIIYKIVITIKVIRFIYKLM